MDILRELHKHTVSVLLATARSNSLVAHFNFPESVRVPCEQFLLYFGQFLKDVGVKATTE
jgi:hypothetical protein